MSASNAVVDRGRRRGTQGDADQGGDVEQRMHLAGCQIDRDGAREDHELHHVRLAQPPEVPQAGGAQRHRRACRLACRRSSASPPSTPALPGLNARSAACTTGRSSKVWNGGGELTVHSSVVAPSPHGLSGHFSPAVKRPVDHVDEEEGAGGADERADRGDQVPAGERVRIVRDAARHAGEAQEVLREEGQVDADEGQPEVDLAQALVVLAAATSCRSSSRSRRRSRTWRPATARSGSARRRSRCRAAPRPCRHWPARRR